MEKTDREKIIVEAALKVFSTKGYAATRMADIAKEAGLSYGLVYHYFENKEKLFETIIEGWWQRYYDELTNLRNAPLSTEEKLNRILRFNLDTYAKEPYIISIFITEVSRGFVYHTDPRGQEKFNKLFTLCEDIIAEGQKNGSIRRDINAKYIVYTFLGGIDTFLSVMILGNEKITPSRQKRIAESLSSLFLQGATTR